MNKRPLAHCPYCGHGFFEDDFYEDYCKSEDFAAKITCPNCREKLEICSTIIGTWVAIPYINPKNQKP